MGVSKPQKGVAQDASGPIAALAHTVELRTSANPPKLDPVTIWAFDLLRVVAALWAGWIVAEQLCRSRVEQMIALQRTVSSMPFEIGPGRGF